MKEKVEMMNKMFFEAIEEGNVHNIIALLRIGISPNERDRWGETALMRAAYKGNEKATELLLAYPGIDVNMQNERGYTALMWAAWEGKEKCVKLLLKHPGIDVNLRDENGQTALMRAADMGREECVELLLNHPDIDVYVKSNRGKTALMLAESHKFKKWEKCVELIKQHIKNKEEAIRSLIQVEMNNAIADLLES
jgi:ankyrin repeat protein